MPEIKNTIRKMKNALDRLIFSSDVPNERVRELEAVSRTCQTEKQSEKEMKQKMLQNIQNCGTITKSEKYM